VYYGFIVTLNIVTIILAVIPQTQLSCNSTMFSYHWFIVCGIDILQSILILISSYFIMDFLKKRKVEEGKKLGGSDDDDKMFECLEIQIKRLAIFYLAFSFIDLMLLGIGNIIDSNARTAFECLHGWYFLVLTNSGVWFNLFHCLFFYFFSIIIWYIFYRLPYNYGLIMKMNTKSLRMTNLYKSTTASNNLKESEVMEEFIKYSQ
jgi:hypothetical protein